MELFHRPRSSLTTALARARRVVDGETGFLVPPMRVPELAAALGRLVADAGLRARLGAAGRARALDLYDEGRVVAHTLDLLGL